MNGELLAIAAAFGTVLLVGVIVLSAIAEVRAWLRRS